MIAPPPLPARTLLLFAAKGTNAMIREDDFRAAMTKRGLTDANVDQLLTWLREDGLVAGGEIRASARHGGAQRLLTPIEAAAAAGADHERAGMFNQLMARARRLGIRCLENGDQMVRLADVDESLRASRASEDERYWIKNALFSLKMIEA